MHELLQSQVATPPLYKLLLLIEALQFFWYTIHKDYSFTWTVQVSTWIQQAVEYLQFDALLSKNDQNFFVIALYLVFSIQLIILILSMLTIFRLVRSNKKTSTVLAYSLKFLSIYGILLNTILAFPFYNIFIGALYCNSSDKIHGTLTCYSGQYWGHFAVGLIGIFVLLFTSFLFNILYIDLNPRSNIPFAAPQSRLNLLRMVLKIAVIIYTVIDQSKNAAKPFIAVYAVMWLLILVLRYRQTPFYNRSIFNYVLGLDSMVFWSTIVGVVEAFIATGDQNETGIFYLFLGFPIISYVFINICAKRRIMFKELTLKNFKKDTDVEMYINIIYHMIENRDQPDNRIALEGLLKFYIKHCHRKDGESPAYQLAKEFIKEEEADEKLWYMWVKEIMVDSFEKFQKSARLHMLYAYIQREKLHNKFKALFEMMITEENKPNMEEEFSIYRYKNLIEEEMIDNDSRNSESKGVDVNIIVHFQNKFVDFQSVVEKAVDLHLDFWRELLEHNPDIHKLQMLGSEITHSVEETSDHFRRLNDINPNHIKMLQIYGNFLKDIVNDDAEGQRILEKAEYVDKSAMVNKQFIDNDRIKYGENSNTCILTCSGNFNDMGIITNVNNEIVRILQYNKSEIIGQPITRIMPKVLADSHDGFMKNYFETSESKIIGQERDVFPTSKAGYVVPCTLMIKVLPNLNEGIRMVGFLKDIEKDRLAKNSEFDSEEKDHYIIYGGDNGIIHGITYSCKQEFGIPSSLVWGAGSATNEFTIDSIFPELLSHDVSELKAASGVITTLDTSNLRQNYLIAHAQSEESQAEEEEEDKEKKFRKTKVRAILVQDDVYKDAALKVLKFFEVHDDDDLKKENSNVKQSAQDEGDNKEEAEEKVKDNDAHNESAENENRSEGSSLSAGEGADDIRTLKDFKALISEKTTPKSIKVLSRAVILMFILLIILTSLDLAFRFEQINTFQTGITTVQQGYQRHNLMAEINYRIRMLQLLATGNLLNPPSTLETDLRNQLVSLIDSLSSVQFQIMTATQTLSSDGYYTVDSQYITLEHLLESTINYEDRIYTDSVFQYITAASSIRNSTLTQLSVSSTIDSTLKNFYFVRRNGLGPLRVGSENAADNFMNYYMDKADKYNTKFEIIMIVGIILLALSEFILIPIVFSVHRTNNRVLSLFGFIPLSEITELASKCERYMANYLEDHKERKEYSGDESGEDGADQEQNSQQGKSYIDNSQVQDQELVEGDSVHPDASVQMDVSERMDAHPIGVVPVNQTKKSQVSKLGEANQDKSALVPGQNKTDKSGVNVSMAKRPIQLSKEEERKNAAEAEADADLLNDRSQKLLNSRDNRKGKVIFQFTLITLTFVAYYIADYVHELNILSNVRNSYSHLQLSAQRMPDLRYVVTFTQEIIAEGDIADNVYKYKNTSTDDLRKKYLIATQTNDKNLRDSEKKFYPSSFDSYFVTFGLYNDQNLCSSYYVSSQSSCNLIASGLLSKGISVSVTTVTLNSDDVYAQFHQLPDRTLASAKQSSLNITKFQDSRAIQDNILPACQSLISTYISAFNDYMSRTTNDERIKFAIFVIWCFFVFFVLWGQYLKSLNDKIFRTKGMLNMIPMEIISKNENLKQLFFSGDILQAVK